MAQDLLNVEVTPGGKSVRKRKGLGLAYTLPISTSPVHGIYSFYDSSGNDVSLFFNDSYLTSSVSGGSLTTLFSTGTYNATYQCTDSLGFAYCANTARTPIMKTDGATAVPLSVSSTGTMVTATTQRLATAGFASTPSQINFSGANDFTNWTLGGLNTSPYNETINAPGSRITHITYACNGLMWFKEVSFGIILNPDDALNAQTVILAPEIGTLDNTSVQYPGGLQFRSKDGHIYNFDCAGIAQLTQDISDTVDASGSRLSNSWNQTSQSDWQSGASVPTANLSTSLSAGDVIPSSFSISEYSSATGWGSGTSSNMAVGTSSISLTVANANITNNSFESGSIDNWTLEGGGTQETGITGVNCSVTPRTGSKILNNGSAADSSWNIYAALVLCSGGPDLTSSTAAFSTNSCSWTSRTLSSSGQQGKSVKLVFSEDSNSSSPTTMATSDCFVNSGTDITYYTASDQTRVSPPPELFQMAVDDVTNGSSTITLGSFTSQLYNTGFTSSTLQFGMGWTVNTSTPTFAVLHSTSVTGTWATLTTSSGTNHTARQYVKIVSTISIVGNQSALTYISSFTLLSRSSGTFYSAVKNAASLSSWDTFLPTYAASDATVTFYLRSSTEPIAVLQSTPSWVAQSAGGVVSASTGTYFQVRTDFALTAATQTPSLSDFTVNWFEGTAADKPYAIYFGDDNALWWSVAFGEGQSTNNRILRWDLDNNGWVLYDIPANGFLIRNQDLYIGSADAGKIYKFGDTDSDDGTAIESYWKSKDFSLDDPMVDKEFRTISVIAKSVENSSMTVTYTINASSSIPYTVYLYNANSSILRNNRYLPTGKVGNTFNLQFGNDAADQFWELFGAAFRYLKKPWITGN